MRTIRFRIVKKDIRDLLTAVSREQGVKDSGYIQDLYALMRMKGKGLPTDRRIKKMSKAFASKEGISEINSSILMRKRVLQLKAVVQTAYFKALCSRKDTIESVRMCMVNFAMLHKKVRQAQCISCNLRANCEFGKQYSAVVKDITKVLDPNYTKKAHEDCPVLPEIETTNQIAQAADAFSKMFRQSAKADREAMKNMNQGHPATKDITPPPHTDEIAKLQEVTDEEEPDVDADEENLDAEEIDTTIRAENFGADQDHQGGGYNVTHSGNNNIVVMEDFIKKIQVSNLVLFELGRKFTRTLESGKAGKFAPTENVDRSKTTERMENVSDIVKLEPSQHGLPEEIFNAKADKRELLKQQHLTKKDKKKGLYLLIDASGSMGGWLGKGDTTILTRASLAVTLSLALLRRVRDDKGYAYCRFFENSVSRLVSAKEPEEFDRLMFLIANASFKGMGTNILVALGAAVADIKQAEKVSDLASTEILGITDCEDTFDVNGVKAAISEYEFNVLDVSGKSFNNQGASGQLKAVSNKYYKADETTLDPNKIVELI